MINPSSEWTAAERLEVIKAKTRELGDALQADAHSRAIGHQMLMVVTEQLNRLASAPAEALEANRDDLLTPILYQRKSFSRSG